MEWAEHQFRQNRSTADGATEGDHLESAARQLANLPGRKKKPVEIVPDAPPFPDELSYLWQHFIELAGGLASNGFGPPLVTWEALQAWQIAMDIGPLEPWEMRTLVDLGRLRAGVQAEKSEAERRVKGAGIGRPGAASN